jgi:hypothetical protein
MAIFAPELPGICGGYLMTSRDIRHGLLLLSEKAIDHPMIG